MLQQVAPSCAVCHQETAATPLLETRFRRIHISCSPALPAFINHTAEFSHLGQTPLQPSQHLEKISDEQDAKINTHLEHWVNQGIDQQDKHIRAVLAIQFKAMGITLNKDQLILHNSLRLDRPSGLTGLPKNLKIIGDLEISFGNDMPRLCDKLEVTGGLKIKACAGLVTLADKLEVQGLVYIERSTRIATLAKTLKLHSSLHLERAHSLESLPDNLHVPGSLILKQCKKLITLPNNCQIDGHFSATQCELFEAIPERVVIGEDIHIDQCEAFTTLPCPLQCQGNLKVRSCKVFSAIPDQGDIAGDIQLNENPSLQDLPDWIFTLGSRQMNGDTTMRLINIQGTGIPQEQLQYIEDHQYHGIQFLTGLQAQQSSQDHRRNVYLDHGNEAPILLDILRETPQQNIVVYYKGEDGIDQGGPTRQAFTKAYKSLLKNTQLFNHSDNGINIKPQYKSASQIESAAKDFGQIIGRIMLQHMAVGYDFHPDVYQKMAKASQIYQSIPELKTKAYTLAGYIGICNREDLVAIECAMNPTTFNSQDKRDYLHSLPLEDIRDYINKSTMAYLGIAAGMSSCGLFSVSRVDFIKERLCGPENLKAFFLEKLHVKVKEYVPKIQHAQIKSWIRQLIVDANANELKKICMEMTGAESLYSGQKHITISMGVYESDAYLSAHSCSRKLTLNYPFFQTFIENNQYDRFKSYIMQDFIKRFNDA